jgi:broad specificity phosphatase PhoE
MVIHLIRHLKPQASSEPLDLEVACVLSSPLERAHRTARLFFPQHDIQLVPELAEIAMGEWEGRPWEDIEANWPDLAREKLANWFTVTPPGGEPWKDFEARVTTAWARIRSAPSPCAVVAHAGTNFVLAKLITGRELSQPQSHGEVISLETH